jgi:ATPases involved in chromosome partitioning
MSQNFELLNQLEAEIGLGTVIPKTTTRTGAAARKAEYASTDQGLLSLMQTVFFSGAESAPHEVVLAGIDRDGGSSEICLQLGQILAKASSKPVCLIDSDLRSSRLVSAINARRHAPIRFPEQERYIELQRNLWLASSVVIDPTQTGSLAQAQYLKKSIADLRTTFEYILIDAPGVNAGSEAAVLGQLVDSTILVIEANSTRKAGALKAKRTLEAVNVKLLGTILNNRTFPVPEKLYRKL